MSHTPEPWEVWTSNSHIRISSCGRDGDVCCATIASDGMAVLSISIADAERIVACVNACAGISTEALEEAARSGKRVSEMLLQQRDDLLRALKGLVDLDDGDESFAWDYEAEFEAGRAAIAKVKQS